MSTQDYPWLDTRAIAEQWADEARAELVDAGIPDVDITGELRGEGGYALIVRSPRGVTEVSRSETGWNYGALSEEWEHVDSRSALLDRLGYGGRDATDQP